MIKERIKELREKNNLTISAFARSIGISPTSVSLYESGRQNPGKKTIQRICEVYGVDESYLTSDDKAATEAGKTDKEIKAEKQPEMKPEKKPEMKPEKKPEMKPEMKPEKKPEMKPEIKPEKQPEMKPEIKPEMRPEKQPEMKPEIKPEKKPKKKKEKMQKKGKKKKSGNKAAIIIQSPEGKDITPKQIRKLVPEGTDYVCVRVDENRLYWVKGSQSGATDIW